MKLYFTLFVLLSTSLFSQYGNFRTDDGTVKGYYNGLTNFEESVLLKPNGPGLVSKIYIYLSGPKAGKDTIWITQDPTDGYLPGSLYCNYISAFNGYVVDYMGTQDWYSFDVSDLNIRTGGINGIWIQHTIKPNGPYFVIDNGQDTANYTSFLNDVYKPNPNFYNIKGSMVSICQGDYVAGMDIIYDYPEANKSAKAPYPVLNDVTVSANLIKNSKVIASEMVSVADWNNDGWDDIAIKSNFFQNNGDGTFSDVSSKINAPNNGTIWADLDNDGNIDFFAANGWINDRIYWGTGDGTFIENTDMVVIQDAPTVSPLFLDYDNDGFLDIYVAYGRKETSEGETYYADRLYKNIGGRKFVDVTQQAGITAENTTPYDCWAASVTDYNSDGFPDIFVATYRLAPDLLYKNNGNGTFTEVGAITGARGAQTYSPGYFGHGMGSDWADMDNDGDLDLCVGNLAHWDERALSSNPSLILMNQGTPDYKFKDNTKNSGLKFFEMNSGTVWADLDLDGYQDLWHCQYSYEAKGKSLDKYSRVYMNRGPENDYFLDDMTWDFGAYIHGAWSPVRIDYDNDGDMDLLIGSSNENVKLFENNIKREGNWISFRLVGSPANKVNAQGYGAWITVTVNGEKFYRAIPGSILNARASQSSNELNFGLGKVNPDDAVSVEVKFNDGKILTFKDVIMNRKYLIKYDGMIIAQNQARPTLVIPENNSKVKANEIFMGWHLSSGANSYKLQVSETNDFTDLTINETLDNYYANNINLQENKTYFWRVKAISDDYETMWSPVWQFNTLESGAKPSAPNLISPANNTTNVELTPELLWTIVDGTKVAGVYISEKSDFSTIDLEVSIESDYVITDYNITEDVKLKENTKYYWKVRLAYEMGQNGNIDWGDWSEVFTFTTTDPSNVEMIDEIMELSDVSPNPVKNNFELIFNIKKSGNVNLSIYNSIGEMVSTICDEKMNSGIYKYVVNAEQFNSGAYYYTLTVDGISKSKKFVVVK